MGRRLLDKTKLVRTREQSAFGGFGPLIDPQFVPAEKAHWPLNEVVIGIQYFGIAKAYPTSMLCLHHCVNDLVYVKPVLISFCNLCSSGIAFDPQISRHRQLTFELYGVYQGAMVMADQQTGSLWSHLEGRCLAGKLAGHELKPLPVVHATWAQWLQLHPDTLVLSRNTPYRDRYRPLGLVKARLGSGYRWFPTDWRKGLQPEQLVLGIRTEEGQWAYPLAELEAVTNQRAGSKPLVIFYRREVEHAIAFLREVEGEELTFEARAGEIRDGETGSLWSGEGRCLEGPLAGRALAFVPSVTVEWYAWSAYYPQTRLMRRAYGEGWEAAI